MKPTSVIFLILAAALIVSGAVVCSVAQSKAKSENVSIFCYEYNENGEPTEKIDLTTENINKISVSLADCDIEIVTGAEKSELELVNFEKYKYSLSTSDSELALSDSIGIKSVIRFSSGSFSFEGLRYIFPFGGKGKPKIAEGTQRRAILRLADTTVVRNAAIEIENGDVSLNGLTLKADFDVSVENGNISVVSDSSAVSYKLTVKNGNIDISDPAFSGSATVRAEKGDISISVNKSSECEYKLEAPLGAVSYYGTSSGHAYTTGTTYDAKITANADTGNIALIEAESSGAENSGSENSETENSESK